MPANSGNSNFLQSLRCALSGFAEALRIERNLKIQIGFAVLAIVLGLAFSISLIEWLVIIVCIGAVFGLECMNTALESVVDLASPDYHELARRAKDVAAGGVLAMAICSFVIGATIFAPRIIAVLIG